MFPQAGTQAGGGFNTSPILQQHNNLLGNSQFQNPSSFPTVDPVAMNSTAPQSGANPAVAGMVKALKGGQ